MAQDLVWQNRADQFMSVRHLSQERSLHPEVLRLVESHPGDQLLDYGCGDGRILERLSSRWIVDAYDPSAQMRQIAKRRVGSRLRRLCSKPDALAERYHVIILGMVILTIPDEGEIARVLRNCAQRMDESSRLVVTTTHPCFRDRSFSNLSTSFVEQKPFRYQEEGAAFKVTLQDRGDDGIVFTDYHWSLEFTVGALRKQGLIIESLLEVPDDPASPHRNSLVPLFLVLNCRRFA